MTASLIIPLPHTRLPKTCRTQNLISTLQKCPDSNFDAQILSYNFLQSSHFLITQSFTPHSFIFHIFHDIQEQLQLHHITSRHSLFTWLSFVPSSTIGGSGTISAHSYIGILTHSFTQPLYQEEGGYSGMGKSKRINNMPTA